MARKSVSQFDKDRAKTEGATPLLLGPAYSKAAATTPASTSAKTPQQIGRDKFDPRTPGSGAASAKTPKSPPVAPSPKSPKSNFNRLSNLGDFAHPTAKKKRR